MAEKDQTHTAHDANKDREPTETEAKESKSGRGWHGDPAGHAAAGRKGGQKVARNRAHMAEIGRKGGESVSQDRSHMAEIGRKGGLSKTDASPSEKESS